MNAPALEWPCGVRTKRGTPCMITVPEYGAACHVHDPDGAYANQHPKFRAKLLNHGTRPDPEAQLRAQRKRRCSLCWAVIYPGDPILTTAAPGDSLAVGHPGCVLDARQAYGGEHMPQAP